MTRIALVFVGVCMTIGMFIFQQFEIATIASNTEDIKEALQFIIKQNDPVAFTVKDEQCLAKNIYHEAGVEDVNGKYAVAQVTLNRLRNGKWGHNLCDVVYAKAQFSWTLFTKRKQETPKGQLWEESKVVAHKVLHQSYRVPSLQNSLYYHADYVNPKWKKAYTKVQQVGAHIFYQAS